MRRTSAAATLVAALLALLIATAGAAPAAPQPEASLTRITSVVAGLRNTCAVTANGQARCWGYGFYGANGTGTTSQFDNAATVRNRTDTGPLVNVRQVAVGQEHACALLTSGQVRCWGRGQHGQMGNGTTTESNLLPVVVGNATGNAPLAGVTGISADSDYTCALLENRQVRCWGGNPDGQLGDGTEDVDRLRPVAVKAVNGAGNLTGITQIDAGEDQACARTAAGQARCWGLNDTGQLGDGTEDNSLRPVVVRNVNDTGALTAVRRVTSGGYHSCAVLDNGQARCWGYGFQGELGDGPPADSDSLPVVVSNPAGTGPLTGVRSVDEGYGHTCAVVVGGEVRCWGDNGTGYLGIGTTGGQRLRPVRVRNVTNTASLSGATQLSTGVGHTCVRLTNGQARCWGEGSFGRLGDDDTGDEPLPVKVES
jgi:alpha-tubulin suppressor-like RCC1 family protein